jgi:hypothetical protein
MATQTPQINKAAVHFAIALIGQNPNNNRHERLSKTKSVELLKSRASRRRWALLLRCGAMVPGLALAQILKTAVTGGCLADIARVVRRLTRKFFPVVQQRSNLAVK